MTARFDRLPWLMPALVGAAVMVMAAGGNAGGDSFGLCPYRNLFGVACPGCGMSRATAAVVRGDFAAGLGYHPLVPLFLAQVVAGLVVWTGHRRGWWPVDRRVTVVLGVVNIVALVGVWAVRALTGSLPPV